MPRGYPGSAKHGTRAGYMAHLRGKTSPCAECSKANLAYMREWRRGKRPKQVLAKCGTKAAQARHRRRGETCAECVARKPASRKEWRKKKPTVEGPPRVFPSWSEL